jgi:hypothetical protein
LLRFPNFNTDGDTMSRIQPRNNSADQAANLSQSSSKEMTRKEKTASILTDVLPMALSLGFELGGVGNTKSSGRTGKKGSVKTGSTKAANSKIGGAAGAAGTRSAVSGWAGIAGGVMGALDIALNWGRSTPAKGAASGSAVGAMIGTFITPGIGTAIGAALGAIGGGLLGSIKTGKHADQKLRDEVRGLLVEKGVLDSNYAIGLADGSRFDIGYDGGPKKELGGRRPYETDAANPLTKYAVSWLNPVVAFLSQGNPKVQSDFVGYFANAATSNAKSLNDVKANVNTIMKQFGLNDTKLVKGISQAAEAGELPADEAQAWLNGVRERTSTDFKGDTQDLRGRREYLAESEDVDALGAEVQVNDEQLETV